MDHYLLPNDSEQESRIDPQIGKQHSWQHLTSLAVNYMVITLVRVVHKT